MADGLRVALFREKCYEVYRLDWMLRHGYSLTQMFSSMEQIWADQGETSPEETFRNWEMDSGFGSGSIWVCFAEFLGNEYLAEEYMKCLFEMGCGFFLDAEAALAEYREDPLIKRVPESTVAGEWTLTDDDSMQYRRCAGVFNGKKVFELFQINSYPNNFGEPPTPDGYYYRVAHGFIYLSDYDTNEIDDAVFAYGYPSAKDLPDENIAEMLFELSATECDLPLEFPTWEAAKKDLLERVRASKKI